MLAQHVHLPAGEFETAERLAREAETDLTARGHEAQVAVAIEVLAAVAEGRGDVRQALEELRRARPHLEAAHEEATRARAALAAALSRDEDRIPSAAATGDAPDRATGEDADGAWAMARSGAGPAEIATDTPSAPVAEPAQAFALDGLPASSEPEDPEESVAGSDAVSDSPEPAAEPAAAPRRRRNRYREEGDPGDLLAAALAAARGEFVAFSTARATAEPAATDSEPPEQGPAETLTDGPHDDTPGDDTRSDATARATTTPRPPGAGGSPGLARGGRRRSRSCPVATTCPGPPAPTTGGTTPSAGGTTSTGRPVGAPTRTGSIPSRIVDTGTPAGGRRAPTTATRSASSGPPPGRGTRTGSGPGVGGVTPSTTRTLLTAAARPGVGHTGTNGQGGQNAHGVDSRSALGRSALGQGVTTGPGAGPGGVDDELARELALTLVDLLSEYEDAGVPLGGGLTNGSPTPLNGTNGHTTVTSSGARPAGPAAAPRTSTGTGATHATPSSPAPSRNAGLRGPRNGVPSARGADDSGPRLADLLADAMDAYHSAGPGPDAADDRRARR